MLQEIVMVKEENKSTYKKRMVKVLAKVTPLGDGALVVPFLLSISPSICIISMSFTKSFPTSL
jgi:hypothetical protein